jgi:hypothetical protein
MRPHHRVLPLLAAALAAAAWTHPVHAQGGRPLNVMGRQGLTFGTMWSGQPAQVSRQDPLRSGQVELRGMRNTDVQITFSLPASLTGPGGAQLPLSFSANDGGVGTTATITAATGFDPRLPRVAQFSGNGRLYLFLGGTALPGVGQTAGAYTATVTVTVAYTGT